MISYVWQKLQRSSLIAILCVAALCLLPHAESETVTENQIVDSVQTQTSRNTERAEIIPSSTTDETESISHISSSISTPVESIAKSATERAIESSYTVQDGNYVASEILSNVNSMSVVLGISEIETLLPRTHFVLGTSLEPEILPTVTTHEVLPNTSFVLGTSLEPEILPTVTTHEISPFTSFVQSNKPVQFEQRIIHDGIEAIVYDYTLEHNELVVSSNNTALTNIVVTEQTDEPRINFENLVEVNNNNATVIWPNDLEMDVVFDGIEANLLLTSNTTITTSAQWDGVMNLPTFTDTSEVDTSLDMEVTAVLEVGLDEDMLVFDKPVRILFEERAGQDVGFSRNDDLVIIDDVCDADDLERVAEQLAGEGECRMDVDSDLIVWTFHFTKFVTLTDIPQQDQDPSTVPPPDGNEPPETNSQIPDESDPDVLVPEISGGIPRDDGFSGIGSIPDRPQSEIRTPRSSGGGGGGGGGGGSITFDPLDSSIPAILDFTSRGTSAVKGSAIHVDADSELVITPITEDYELNTFEMEVIIYKGSKQDVLVRYATVSSILDPGQCSGVVHNTDRIYTCDTGSLLSHADTSYTQKESGSRIVLDSIIVPFEQDVEYAGKISVMLRDSHGIQVFDHNGWTYDITIGKQSQVIHTPEPAEIIVEPDPKPAEIVVEPEPEPVKMVLEPEPEPAEIMMDPDPYVEPTSKPEPDSKPEPNTETVETRTGDMFSAIIHWFRSLFG